jgi:glyoxylase-like metal-dependent hydrolase (beta-lactamase superfamily II)
MSIPFIKTLDFKYGEISQLSPLIARVVCNNPSPFTFYGTGTYLIGQKDLVIIDPGPDDDAHLLALMKAIDGRNVSHILITHPHADHSPLATKLSGATGAKIWGKAETKGHKPISHETEEGDDFGFIPDFEIHDGQIIQANGFEIECIATSGHTSGHFCFGLACENALFSGDHIMGWSTSVILPPDGNMNQYIASLEKVLARDFGILYPTHGAPIPSPLDFINAYIAHRLERETQILQCLQNGITQISQMVPILYANVDKRLWPAAARSLHAHLIRLVENGRAKTNGAPKLDTPYNLI